MGQDTNHGSKIIQSDIIGKIEKLISENLVNNEPILIQENSKLEEGFFLRNKDSSRKAQIAISLSDSELGGLEIHASRAVSKAKDDLLETGKAKLKRKRSSRENMQNTQCIDPRREAEKQRWAMFARNMISEEDVRVMQNDMRNRRKGHTEGGDTIIELKLLKYGILANRLGLEATRP